VLGRTGGSNRRAERHCYRATAMSRDRRRALRLLAGSPLGVTEAIMLAHGFISLEDPALLTASEETEKLFVLDLRLIVQNDAQQGAVNL
jgi:hypothetical protein